MTIELFQNGTPIDTHWPFDYIPNVGDYIMINGGAMGQYVVSNISYCTHIETIQINVIHTFKKLEDYAKERDAAMEQHLKG